MYAEALKPTNEVTKSGAPILFCDVCQQKVYTVRSKEELAEKRVEGRCVKFNRKLLDSTTVGSLIRILVLVDDTNRDKVRQLLVIQATSLGLDFGPTFQPFEVLYEETDVKMQFHTLTLEEARRSSLQFQEVVLPEGNKFPVLSAIPGAAKATRNFVNYSSERSMSVLAMSFVEKYGEDEMMGDIDTEEEED